MCLSASIWASFNPAYPVSHLQILRLCGFPYLTPLRSTEVTALKVYRRNCEGQAGTGHSGPRLHGDLKSDPVGFKSQLSVFLAWDAAAWTQTS